VRPLSWDGETVSTVDRETIYEELQRVRVAFRRLVEDASPGDLARASAGTRWTNQQLLFHMLFGYLVTRALIVLAGMFARLPASVSRVFARLLDAVTGPFDRASYLGSCAGAKVFPLRRMAGKLDQVTMALEQRLPAQTDARLRSGMHYPVRWDPFFKDFMTVADLYHYPTQHFGFPPAPTHARPGRLNRRAKVPVQPEPVARMCLAWPGRPSSCG
jgi:DinB superfamily